MSLCDLCAKIPWEDLPTVPPNLAANSTGQKYIHPLVRWPSGVRSYEHHRNLEELRQSALSCGLCDRIYSSANNVQKELEELKPKWEAKEAIQYDWPTFELFVVKRREGGDGCWVMSFVDGDTERVKKRKERGLEDAWIIAAIGLCVKEDDPLQDLVNGRIVDGPANSLTALARSRKWLQACDRHNTCKPSETLLPSRVIDVGTTDSPEVRLWEPIPEGTVGNYVTLSHCWGESQEFTTTRASMEERKAGMKIADMPATYQDVIKLTRELGLRYLWVDSLCICQDERDDWGRESAKMLSIYSNAYLTVSAARAKNSSDGFLGARIERTFVEMDYTRDGIHGRVQAFNLPLREELIKRDYIDLKHEPLSKRAWGFQERVLSRRNLIYGSDQMYFECNEGFRGEDGLYLKQRHECVHKQLESQEFDKRAPWMEGLVVNEKPKRDLLKGWYNLLWLYGPKRLTCANDKLPAISGIASLYAAKIGEEYLAGLWRGQLIEGLMWQSLRFRRAKEYRAPSWSWASGDGIPATGQIVDYKEIAEIIDAKVTLKGGNPFGEVTDGYIKLRAPLERLYLLLDDWNPEAPGHKYNNNVKVRTENGDKTGFRSRFDFHFTADDAPQEARKIVESLEGVEIFALFILKSRSWAADAAEDEGTYDALIVKKVDSNAETYVRLGFLLADKHQIGRQPETEDRESFPVVTLV